MFQDHFFKSLSLVRYHFTVNGIGKMLIILVMKWYGEREMPVTRHIGKFPLAGLIDKHTPNIQGDRHRIHVSRNQERWNEHVEVGDSILHSITVCCLEWSFILSRC